MKKIDPIKLERLKELLDYKPDTGELIWRIDRGGRRAAKAGDVAGCLGEWDGKLRRVIRVDRKMYYASRLAWFLATGEWPRGVVDHVNGDPSDDRICNLRDVDEKVNAENKFEALSSNKSSGLLGVSLHRQTGKWRAYIVTDRKQKHLGLFATKEEASESYWSAKRSIHEGCAA